MVGVVILLSKQIHQIVRVCVIFHTREHHQEVVISSNAESIDSINWGIEVTFHIFDVVLTIHLRRTELSKDFFADQVVGGCSSKVREPS